MIQTPEWIINAESLYTEAKEADHAFCWSMERGRPYFQFSWDGRFFNDTTGKTFFRLRRRARLGDVFTFTGTHYNHACPVPFEYTLNFKILREARFTEVHALARIAGPELKRRLGPRYWYEVHAD
jgi:hypothetical protein